MSPSDAKPETSAPANSNAETLSPLPGEAGIPSVAAHRRRGEGRTQLLAFSALVLAMAGVSAWAYQHFAPPPAKNKPDPRLADKPAAAGTETRRLELSPAPMAMPRADAASTPSGPTRNPDRATATAAPASDPLGIQPQSHAMAGHPSSANAPSPAIVGTPASTHMPPPLPATDAPVLLVASRTAVPPTGHPTQRPTSTAPAGMPSSGSPGQDPLTATARNLEGYQQQLQGLLDTLTRTTALSVGQAGTDASPAALPYAALTRAPNGVPAPAGAPMAAPIGVPPATTNGGLFGGQLPASSTPRVAATTLGNRSLMLAKGTAFTCALKTNVISATSGLVGCQVQRNVYSDDGRVLLIERGSHLDGEYRIGNVRQGMVRIPVLWTRVRTPHGVTVDLESPGTGALGESGIDGHVDNRWPERIGAAMLLSLIDDSVKLVIQNQAHERSGDTIVLPSTTANASKLAEKVLDSTINIPPLIQTNQGSVVGIYVARDIDFSGVYELRPSGAGR